MKTSKYLFVLSLLLGASIQVLFGQEKEESSAFERNITIEREYKPLIQDAKKINSLPFFLELKNPKIATEYEVNFNKPLRIEQNIFHLPQAKLSPSYRSQKEGFARLGIGTGINSLADFAFPLLKRPDAKLDFILHHYGLLGAKAHANSSARLDFNKSFNTLKIFSGISAEHEYFKYYGSMYKTTGEAADKNFLDSDTFFAQGTPRNPDLIEFNKGQKSNSLTRLNFYAGIQDRFEEKNELSYVVRADYNYLGTHNRLNEQRIDITSNTEFLLFSGRFGIDAALSTLLYTSPEKIIKDRFKSYAVISATPYYLLSGENWNLRLGLSAYFALGYNHNSIATPNATPDVHFEFNVLPRFIALYAGAGGEYKINSLNSILKENCFYSPDIPVNNTETPFDLYVGTKIKPFTGFLIDLHSSYKYVRNQYFFVNKEYTGLAPVSPPSEIYTNRFDVAYSPGGRFQAGAKLSYSYHNIFSLRISGVYNHWSLSDFNHPWHKPAWELDMSTNFRINQQLNFYASLHSSALRYAKIANQEYTLSPKLELNIGGNYALEDWFSVFARVNNLLNNKYEQWKGYQVQGINLMGGIIFNF